MKQDPEELEVKFYLSDMEAFERKVARQGKLQHARVFEQNLRFDTVDGRLTAAHQVLRLRKDDRVRMTYKGPSDLNASVAKRREIEFELSDLDAAKTLLEALDFHVSTVYEKYRTTYMVNGAEVVIDELPCGNFCEIEGRDEKHIHDTADALCLVWEHRYLKSYTQSFQDLKAKLNLQMNDLTFTAFAGLTVTAEDLGIVPGDRQ